MERKCQGKGGLGGEEQEQKQGRERVRISMGCALIPIVKWRLGRIVGKEAREELVPISKDRSCVACG